MVSLSSFVLETPFIIRSIVTGGRTRPFSQNICHGRPTRTSSGMAAAAAPKTRGFGPCAKCHEVRACSPPRARRALPAGRPKRRLVLCGVPARVQRGVRCTAGRPSVHAVELTCVLSDAGELRLFAVLLDCSSLSSLDVYSFVSFLSFFLCCCCCCCCCC